MASQATGNMWTLGLDSRHAPPSRRLTARTTKRPQRERERVVVLGSDSTTPSQVRLTAPTLTAPSGVLPRHSGGKAVGGACSRCVARVDVCVMPLLPGHMPRGLPSRPLRRELWASFFSGSTYPGQGGPQ